MQRLYPGNILFHLRANRLLSRMVLFALVGYIQMLNNRDVPGVVGRVGTLLATPSKSCTH